MVQPVPNRSQVLLRPLGSPEEGPAGDWARLPVEVLSVQPLRGQTDLLSGWEGRVMTAVVPAAALAQHDPMDQEPWQVEASLAGPATLRVMPPESAPRHD